MGCGVGTGREHGVGDGGRGSVERNAHAVRLEALGLKAGRSRTRRRGRARVGPGRDLGRTGRDEVEERVGARRPLALLLRCALFAAVAVRAAALVVRRRHSSDCEKLSLLTHLNRI